MHNNMPQCITDSDLVVDFFPNIKILKKKCYYLFLVHFMKVIMM